MKLPIPSPEAAVEPTGVSLDPAKSFLSYFAAVNITEGLKKLGVMFFEICRRMVIFL